MKVVNISQIHLSNSGEMANATFQLRQVAKRKPNNKLLLTTSYSATSTGSTTGISYLSLANCPEIQGKCSYIVSNTITYRNSYFLAGNTGQVGEHDYYTKKSTMLLIDDLPPQLTVASNDGSLSILWKYTFVLNIYEVEV